MGQGYYPNDCLGVEAPLHHSSAGDLRDWLSPLWIQLVQNLCNGTLVVRALCVVSEPLQHICSTARPERRRATRSPHG
jgi:hypothetical protein